MKRPQQSAQYKTQKPPALRKAESFNADTLEQAVLSHPQHSQHQLKEAKSIRQADFRA